MRVSKTHFLPLLMMPNVYKGDKSSTNSINQNTRKRQKKMSMRSRPAATAAPERTASDFNDSPFVVFLRREKERMAQTSASIPDIQKVSCEEIISSIEKAAARLANPTGKQTSLLTRDELMEYYSAVVDEAREFKYLVNDNECSKTLDKEIEFAMGELKKLGVTRVSDLPSYRKNARELQEVEEVD